MKALLMQTLRIIYAKATKFAMEHNQVVGEDNEYFITLRQLEELFKEWDLDGLVDGELKKIEFK